MSAFFISHPNETDLALFAGGELGPLSRWRIERHLESCTACRETVAEFFALNSELNELEAPEPDWTALKQSIHNSVVAARLEQDSQPARSGWVWQFGLAAAAMVCAVAVYTEWPTAVQEPSEARQDVVALSAPLESELVERAESRQAPAQEQLAQAKQKPAVDELEKAEAPAPAPERMNRRLVSDIAAPPPPQAPYPVEAQPLVEARELDAQLGPEVGDYRSQQRQRIARKVSADGFLDAAGARLDSGVGAARNELLSILEADGPLALLEELETRRESPDEEAARLLAILDADGLDAVVADLRAQNR